VWRLHPVAAPGPVRPPTPPGLPARLPGGRDGAAVSGRTALRLQRGRPALPRRLLRPAPGARAFGHPRHHFPLGRLGAGPAGAGARGQPGPARSEAGDHSEGAAAWLRPPHPVPSNRTPAATAIAGATGASPPPARPAPRSSVFMASRATVAGTNIP